MVAPVSVFALSAGGIQSTIASIIISLMLQCGVAPVNTNYINALNTSYGYTIETAISEGLLTETAEGLVDTGLASAIEEAAAYTDLGLADIFTTTIDDVGVAAASGGVNIAKTAVNVGKFGNIGSFAGAVAIGVGVGVLANHIREILGNYIKYGVSTDVSKDVLSNLTYDNVGYMQYVVGDPLKNPIQFDMNNYENGIIMVGYKMTYGYSTIFRNVTDTGKNYIQKNYKNNVETYNKQFTLKSNTNGTYAGIGVPNTANSLLKSTNIKIFENLTEAETYLKNVTVSDIKSPISPDIIGNIGNQYYDKNNNTYPGITNIIPEGSDMKPIDMNDYQDFVDTANNNTENGDTGQETQGDAFDQFIDPYIVDAPTVPDEPIIPDNPDNTVPEQPDKPLIPDQPTFPDKPEATPEDIQDMGDLTTTPDLRSVFPFCIPWDIYHIFLIFDTGENRKAPHIDFTFPGTDWHIDVDLAQFDPVAALLRLLELILFIVGLAVATRKLIGATG